MNTAALVTVDPGLRILLNLEPLLSDGPEVLLSILSARQLGTALLEAADEMAWQVAV